MYDIFGLSWIWGAWGTDTSRREGSQIALLVAPSMLAKDERRLMYNSRSLSIFCNRVCLSKPL